MRFNLEGVKKHMENCPWKKETLEAAYAIW